MVTTLASLVCLDYMVFTFFLNRSGTQLPRLIGYQDIPGSVRRRPASGHGINPS